MGQRKSLINNQIRILSNKINIPRRFYSVQHSFVSSVIYKAGTVAIFEVSSISELETIIAFFDKYPLITKKRADYELIKQAIDIIQKKEHLTMEGLCKIVAIKASMNWGLSQQRPISGGLC